MAYNYLFKHGDLTCKCHMWDSGGDKNWVASFYDPFIIKPLQFGVFIIQRTSKYLIGISNVKNVISHYLFQPISRKIYIDDIIFIDLHIST